MNQSHVDVKGILLLYHRPTLRRGATTVEENIEAFGRYSKYRVWSLNTEYGFPSELDHIHFSGIVLHYSLFGGWDYPLDKRFIRYLDQRRDSYKIAFFQDEYRYCRQRFEFLNRYDIDCVYTLLEPEYFDGTYRKCTHVKKVISHIPGYVSERLIEAADRLGKPEKDRHVDIGYRARPLEFYMGTGGREKTDIAAGFLERAGGLNLRLNISSSERDRLYGDDWYRFTADCRAFLGVEAGVSIFDMEDIVRPECERRLRANPQMSFRQLHDEYLYKWEERIPYRTISPRHFEAAAFRVCQILFEGKYSGILKPMVHYIPLKKDFSNFDEAVRLFSDSKVRYELTENAYRDLIVSEKYSYRRFIESFDAELMQSGLKPDPVGDAERVTRLLESGILFRQARAALWGLRFYGDVVPGFFKRPLKALTRRMLYGKALQS